jgi:hypothetical protein
MPRAGRHALFAAPAAAAIPPFHIALALTGGSGPYNVTGASGDIYAQGGSVFQLSSSGGTPPPTFATETITIDANSGTGTLSRVLSGDGVHNTIHWAGMAVGDTILFHLDTSAHDAGTPPQTDTATYPSAGTIAIHRTS